RVLEIEGSGGREFLREGGEVSRVGEVLPFGQPPAGLGEGVIGERAEELPGGIGIAEAYPRHGDGSGLARVTPAPVVTPGGGILSRHDPRQLTWLQRQHGLAQ